MAVSPAPACCGQKRRMMLCWPTTLTKDTRLAAAKAVLNRPKLRTSVTMAATMNIRKLRPAPESLMTTAKMPAPARPFNGGSRKPAVPSVLTLP